MYKITTSVVINEHDNEVTVYGIKNGNTEFNALTTDLSKIESLCQKCNELELDIVHFRDVAEDFIVSKSFDTHEETDL